jgi:hypothetical protein
VFSHPLVFVFFFCYKYANLVLGKLCLLDVVFVLLFGIEVLGLWKLVVGCNSTLGAI